VELNSFWIIRSNGIDPLYIKEVLNMGKTGKKRRSLEKRREKKARKRANYLREGPKAGHVGRRQKRGKFGTFKPKEKLCDHSPTPPGLKARKKNGGFVCSKKKSKFPKLPLRPLRKRLHLGAKGISERKVQSFII
jgi:hypothetical protein